MVSWNGGRWISTGQRCVRSGADRRLSPRSVLVGSAPTKKGPSGVRGPQVRLWHPRLEGRQSRTSAGPWAEIFLRARRPALAQCRVRSYARASASRAVLAWAPSDSSRPRAPTAWSAFCRTNGTRSVRAWLTAPHWAASPAPAVSPPFAARSTRLAGRASKAKPASPGLFRGAEPVGVVDDLLQLVLFQLFERVVEAPVERVALSTLRRQSAHPRLRRLSGRGRHGFRSRMGSIVQPARRVASWPGEPAGPASRGESPLSPSSSQRQTWRRRP